MIYVFVIMPRLSKLEWVELATGLLAIIFVSMKLGGYGLIVVVTFLSLLMLLVIIRKRLWTRYQVREKCQKNI